MTTGIDYRRTDQRTTILENPFWLTSGIISALAIDDILAVMFSFPKVGQRIVIQEVIVQNIEVLTTGVTLDIGLGTIVSDAAPTAVTSGDVDSFIKGADTVVTANTCWGSTTGANASAWLTAKAGGTWVSPRVLTGAASSVPVITARASMSGTIATGTFRVHVLVTILPGT